MDLSEMLELCPNTADVDLSGVPLLADFFGLAGAVGSEFIGKVEGTQGDTGLRAAAAGHAVRRVRPGTASASRATAASPSPAPER